MKRSKSPTSRSLAIVKRGEAKGRRSALPHGIVNLESNGRGL
jgi:hypothetical protein